MMHRYEKCLKRYEEYVAMKDAAVAAFAHHPQESERERDLKNDRVADVARARQSVS